MSPFLTVLTRCHKRPKMLERNQATLAAQSCQDYEQVLAADGESPTVNGEYVMLLDEDREMLHPEAVALLRDVAARHRPDVIVFKADHGSLGILPDSLAWLRGIGPGHIDDSDLAVHAPLWKECAGAASQDGALLAALWKRPLRIFWLNRVLVAVQLASRARNKR